VLIGVTVGIIFTIVLGQRRSFQQKLLQAQELAERDRKYRNLFENSLAGMIRFDLATGEVLDANTAMMRIFRSAARDQFNRALRANRNAEWDRLWDLLVTRGRIENYEFSIRAADGQSVWLSISLATFPSEGVAEGVMVDITEKRAAAEQIREQAELLDKTADAIFVLDLTAHVQYWNKAAEQQFGWPSHEVHRRHVTDYLFPSTLSNDFQKAIGMVRERGEWRGELEISPRYKSAIIAECRFTLVRDEHGHPRAILCLASDITEKKRLETQMLRAQRMESIGTLAGGIAHDLNNILAPIVVSIDILKRTVVDTLGKKTLTAIESSARRGADMVKQVLTFARGIQGERVSMRVEHVIGEVVRLIEETFPRSIEVHNEVPRKLWPIVGDATQIHQVFMNLCVNARDAMENGGVLTLRAQNAVVSEEFARGQLGVAPGPYVHFQVSDTGSGIPETIREKVFEPFFTTKEVGKGTGLGLSTTLGIVKSHGGFLTLDTALGRGTTFHIYFPADVADEERSKETSVEALREGNDELILIVDDESALRDVASSTLETYRYRTITAEDGARALEVFHDRRDEIRVVITDMMMPRVGGAELIREIRRLEPQARIVIMTGMRIPDDIQIDDIKSVDGVLQKPFTTEDLVRTVQEVLLAPKA
jgi:PAS domain S-box-containing protein